LTGRSALPSQTAARYLDAADAAGEAPRLFHWELEFPEVFFDRDGRRVAHAGFDAVIGNPPWDMIRADAGESDARSRARTDMAPVLRFTRDAGIYTAQSPGHANRYQLFVERAIALTRHGGRLGLVLPSGLATDHGSAPLRRMLLSRCDVDAMVGMDNHRGVFPIHRSFGSSSSLRPAGFADATDCVPPGIDIRPSSSRQEEEPPDVVGLVSRARIAGVLERSPGPHSPSPTCAARSNWRSSSGCVAVPPLGSASAGRAIRPGAQRQRGSRRVPDGRHLLPVVEGKHVEPFHVAVDASRHRVGAATHAGCCDRTVTSARVSGIATSPRHEPADADRRVLRAAASRRTRSSVCAPRWRRGPSTFSAACSTASSSIFMVRLRVTTHVTTATVEQLPMPTSEASPAAFRRDRRDRAPARRPIRSAAFARLNARVAGSIS